MATEEKNKKESIFDKIKRIKNGLNYQNDFHFGSANVYKDSIRSNIGITNLNYEGYGGSFLRTINSSQLQSSNNTIISREERYMEYEMMDHHPIIANAIDIITDDIVSQDFDDKILSIKTNNEQLKSELDHLYHTILDIDFNLSVWVRNCLKYGDNFILLQLSETLGIVNTIALPVNYVNRIEQLNEAGDYQITFTFMGSNKPIANEEMLNFKITGNEKYLPYGRSILEPVRRTWKQLRLLEDSLMVYRVTRASERRTIYVEVGNMSPEAAQQHIQQVRDSYRAEPIIDPVNGEINLRCGVNSITDDYFLPVRGGVESNKIDTLPGGQANMSMEDVNIILNELLSGLRIPKSHLNYEQDLNAKATLGGQDIRYSRMIQHYQKLIINELYKVAYIHLNLLDYTEEEMAEFELALYNPSQIATLQKLEVLSTKIDIASKMKDFFSDDYIYKNIFDLTDDEIKKERIRRLNQKKFDMLNTVIEGMKLEDVAGDLNKFADVKFDYDKFFKEEDVLSKYEDRKEKQPKQKELLHAKSKNDDVKIKKEIPSLDNETNQNLTDDMLKSVTESNIKNRLLDKLQQLQKEKTQQEEGIVNEKLKNIVLFEQTNKDQIRKQLKNQVREHIKKSK